MPAPTTLFSSRIDWSTPLREILAWLTDIITVEDDSEQRIGLRQLPRRTLSYSAVGIRNNSAIAAREAALLDNLIWTQQPVPIGIPVWQDATRIGAPAAATDTSITIDTTWGGVLWREFVAGGFVGIWTDPFTWEIQTITGVTAPGTIGVTALAKSWPASAVVFPVTVGTMKPQLGSARHGRDMASVAVSFDCDVLLDTAMAAAIAPSSSVSPWPPVINPGYATTSFLNTLLILRQLAGAQQTTGRRSMVRQESATGIFSYDTPGAAPILTRDVELELLERPIIAILKGILLECAGRMNPFWTPTWQRDLVLAAPIASADTTITIKSCGYTAVFATSPGRRYLCVIDGAIHTPAIVVTGSVDNGDGTETLSVAGPVGAVCPVGTSLEYLLLARMGSDAITLEYGSAETAKVSLPLVELPSEAPAFAAGLAGLGPI